MKNLYLILIYASAAILLFAVAAYYLETELGYVGEVPPERFWTKVRVLLSGPGLTILGLLLIIGYYKTKIHLTSGIVILLAGIIWIALILRSLFLESAST